MSARSKMAGCGYPIMSITRPVSASLAHRLRGPYEYTHRMSWNANVNMTPPRQRVSAIMDQTDEGLGPRAFRTLLQVGDGDARLKPADAAWLFDPVYPEGPCLVEWVGIRAGYRLSAFGQRLYDAANRGDWETIARLTTNPNIDGGLN